MGIVNAPKTCFFTDYPTNNIVSDWNLIEYYCIIGENRINIRISHHEPEALMEYLKQKKWILKGLILNGIWHKENITNQKALDNLIESNNSLIPITPKDKKDKLLNYIYKQQKYDGQDITFALDEKEGTNHKFWELLFFKNKREVDFYINLLENEGLLIVYRMDMPGDAQVVTGRVLSASGIEYLINLQEGEYSNNCFIAMSFTDEMFKVFDSAIQPAIDATGFRPLIISKEHLSSETTINDGIIAGIKKSRFTIADFTDNRNGVYFEAGFALGRGQKVIYTCKEDHLKNLHFDIRAYQQIVWKDAADFKQKLIDKIEAFIK